MSATGNNLIRRGQIFMAAARIKNTSETWCWLMEAVNAQVVNLDNLPATPEARGQIVDLFDEWADDIDIYRRDYAASATGA